MRFFAPALVACLSVGSLSAQSYRHFEATQVHPIAVSADGGRLYACNTPDDRLSVFGLGDADAPRLLAEIPVGLGPVTVKERTPDELWVVSWLSDSIDVVSLSERRVIDSLRVPDEPADVVFAGGKAFVTAQATSAVHVFDAATRTSLGTVDVFGRDPRSMVVNADGTKVYVAVLRSGNGTTVVPFDDAPPPPAPTNPMLPPAPQQALIVADDDPAWTSLAVAKNADNDVVEIDVASLSITNEIGDVGTILYDLSIDPGTNTLWVANLESRNLVPFEPELAAHSIFTRLTKVTTGTPAVVTPYDLNPTVDYDVLPNDAARSSVLSEVVGVVFDAVDELLYVAAQGTDRVGVVDTSGAVTGFVELGATGATIDTRNKRGPRGLALVPSTDRLYVLNRLSHTITTVDTAALTTLDEVSIGGDPMPANEREGRKFVYDAKISGNGTMSCAACHIDGEWDGLAWDLGDPEGDLLATPAGQPFPFNLGVGGSSQFHPMKGPMTTQPLRGLTGVGPLHWRGDRPSIASFNVAFPGVLAGQALPQPELLDMVAYLESVEFPPNPNQNLDRSLPSGPGASAASGLNFFQTTVVSAFGINVSCAACHSLPTGTNGLVIGGTIGQVLNDSISDLMKVPHLRSVYRKDNPEDANGERMLGVGLLHSGELSDVDEFINIDAFSSWPDFMLDDLAEFLLHFDTGTAPMVGHRVALDSSNFTDPSVAQTITTLEARALAGDGDLVALGEYEGTPHGFLYDPGTDTYLSDDPTITPKTRAELAASIQADEAELVVMGVPSPAGQRIARDRDLDGTLNAVDGLVAYGDPTPGCAGEPRLFAPREPVIGEELTFVADGFTPGTLGLLGISSNALSFPALGVTIHIDVTQPSLLILPFNPDVSGFAHTTLLLPNDPTLVGDSRFAQAVFLDACGSPNWAATNGLETIFQP